MYDCIILCGGYGTRIQPLLVTGLPKFLAPVWDERPVGIHIIEYLRSCRTIGNIVLATGYGREHIIKADLPVDGIDLWNGGAGIIPAINHATTSRYSKSGMLKTDQVLILNGDTLFDFNIDYLSPGKSSGRYFAIDCMDNERKHCGITFLTQGMLKYFREQDGNLQYVAARLAKGRFLDIGTPEGYLRAQEPWP